MIEFKNVSLTYPNGNRGLHQIHTRIEAGEFVVIVGLSGAGKSTFIRSINRMVMPTAGELIVDGENVVPLAGKRLRQLRTKVGMIFQQYNLVNRSTVMKNAIAGRLGHTGTLRSVLNLYKKQDRSLAYQSLLRLNIGDKVHARADELSGGEQQRVSIARVLTQEPMVMLADEPVASLDPPTSHQVMRDLKRINEEDGITTLINLHYMDLAMEYADRIIGMRDGEIVFDGPVESVTEATFEEIYGRKIRGNDRAGGDPIDPTN
ncbi:phosphonate ABC transporter ATP-binding protein [Salisediminibacterium beveridgei]|uniref:Phosphonate ABC transporter ATP-binding protein n=1 Tax=Salisediminibacterium beveridgei TaxID=632773 RepID=A0A1D7QY71_9BACI|nr:phosphonate ABC transporter ATP-binding protein [Salisediminibacterium beveridgei]AOM83950.1 Phosphonate ABC transporter ATP-binding protein [Salisediminibacterium beveridgei]